MENNVFVGIKAAVVAACTAFTAAFGWLGWLVAAWIACMAVDYITGTCAAARAGNWSSRAARDGCWHKAGMIFAAIAAGVLDLVVWLLLQNLPAALPWDWAPLVTPLVLCWYILTELGSIVENAAALGAPIPPMLTRMLAVLSAHLDETDQLKGGGQDGGETAPR